MINNRKKCVLSMVFLTSLALFTYMVWFRKFGYYADDWYMIYSGIRFGAARYFAIFASDRPFRGLLQFILYSIFQSNITAYYILSVFIHLFSAFTFLWLLLLLWKNRWIESTLAAAIFLVYPGFLEHPNAFDYQAHLFAMLFMLLSIVFSIKYFQTRGLKRIIYYAGAIILGLFSIMLMEYFIGMEGYRYLFLLMLLWNQRIDKGWTKVKRLVVLLMPFTLGPIVFLFWRVFFFSSTRYATSVSRLATNYIEGFPLSIFTTIKRWITDIGDISFGAFTIPASQLIPGLGMREFITGFALAIIAIVALLIYLNKMRNFHRDVEEFKDHDDEHNFIINVLPLLGLAGAIICLIPINLADREVKYLIFNRFSLPSSPGIAIFMVGLIFAYRQYLLQISLVALILFSAVFTQNANSVRYIDEWKQTQNFWKDFILRVPDLAPGTTLTGYHTSAIQEGYYIWGPANLIYHSEAPEHLISAEVLNPETAVSIELNLPYEKIHRSFLIKHDYAKALVFTKPTTTSCLRFIDNQQIEISIYDHALIRQVAPYSNIDLILPSDATNKSNFHTIFPEIGNDKTWCTLYEQAALQRQFSNWQAVIALANDAENNHYQPFDTLEWMPFIEAYAYLGYFEKADPLIRILNEEPFYQNQACKIFTSKPNSSDEKIQAGNKYLSKAFCE